MWILILITKIYCTYIGLQKYRRPEGEKYLFFSLPKTVNKSTLLPPTVSSQQRRRFKAFWERTEPYLYWNCLLDIHSCTIFSFFWASPIFFLLCAHTLYRTFYYNFLFLRIWIFYALSSLYSVYCISIVRPQPNNSIISPFPIHHSK